MAVPLSSASAPGYFEASARAAAEHGVERGRSLMDVQMAVIAPFQPVQARPPATATAANRASSCISLRPLTSASAPSSRPCRTARVSIRPGSTWTPPGVIGEIQQRAVHIEKQRPIGRDGGRQRKRLGFGGHPRIVNMPM